MMYVYVNGEKVEAKNMTEVRELVELSHVALIKEQDENYEEGFVNALKDWVVRSSHLAYTTCIMDVIDRLLLTSPKSVVDSVRALLPESKDTE